MWCTVYLSSPSGLKGGGGNSNTIQVLIMLTISSLPYAKPHNLLNKEEEERNNKDRNDYKYVSQPAIFTVGIQGCFLFPAAVCRSDSS